MGIREKVDGTTVMKKFEKKSGIIPLNMNNDNWFRNVSLKFLYPAPAQMFITKRLYTKYLDGQIKHFSVCDTQIATHIIAAVSYGYTIIKSEFYYWYCISM